MVAIRNACKHLGTYDLSDCEIYTSCYPCPMCLSAIIWANIKVVYYGNTKEDKMIELWNLVFTQFDSKQVFENPSEFVAADSGASLERIATAYEDKANNYDNSMWYEFIQDIKNNSKTVLDQQARRIADFTNASVGLINEGIKPGKKVQPYMLRKMLRTLYEMCDEYEINIEDVFKSYITYNNLAITKEELAKVVLEEKYLYIEAIKNGLKQAKKIIEKKGIKDFDVTYFKSTFGLPEKYARELIANTSKKLIK